MEDATGHFPERFSKLELIGRGSQGETWRAFDENTARLVAVKVVTLGRGTDWKAFELFERECATLQALDHSGIPDYYEHFSDEVRGRYYLVMEFIEGKSLAQGLDGATRWSETELSALLLDALEIVEYLLDLRPPVVHRDIKPGNLIRRPDGSLVLVDFGGVTDALRRKGGSTMIGTFGYMAPEQLYGSVGPPTDLYALGATIAAVASGCEGEDLPRSGPEIDVDAVVTGPQLRAALWSMTRSDPQRRAASAADVRALLRPPEALAQRPRPEFTSWPAVARSERASAEDRRIAPIAGFIRSLSRSPNTGTPHALMAAVAAFIGFVVSGFGLAVGLALAIGVALPLMKASRRKRRRRNRD